jgi:hypothetical protein
MKTMRRWLAMVAVGAAAIGSGAAAPVDVVVYGATPGGIAAALAAAKGGRTVLLAEPTIRIGGMTTNGLSHPDFRSFEAITGTYGELVQRTLAYYRKTYGENSQQVKDTFRGTHAEPKVNLQLFREMLAEQPTIAVRTEWVLRDAYVRGPAGDRRVRAVRFRDATGTEHEIEAKLFVDGSYEGDLIAAAHIPYRLGMESRDEYGETGAPEDGSRRLQGYNFRLTMTRDPALRVPLRPPPGYRREIFDGVLPLFGQGKLQRVFGGYGDDAAMVKAQIPVLPNGKRDINDAGQSSPVKLSLPGEQHGWPEGDADVRRRIYDEHVLWNVGLIYFMQNDPAVPEKLRAEAREWGWCRDEFVETGHIPPQIYVREGRRMLGLRIFTQHDTRHAEGDARAVLHRDAIATGEYGHSTHGTWHEGTRFGGKRQGFFRGIVYAPYQIPYGTIVPKDVRNVLAPVPASASHVGFCALRLEPIWSSLGQAAGHAAHLALAKGGEPDVRTVDVAALQRRLHADRSATIYVGDVPPEHPDFAAVQWWGGLGGLHGLAPRPTGRLLGPTIEGQHNERWLNHDAELDRPLEAAVAERWTKLARAAGVTATLPAADGRTTRGAWIRAASAAAP